MNRRFSAILAALVIFLSSAAAQERFPRPEFESDYQQPSLELGKPNLRLPFFIDLTVLAAALAASVWLVHRTRSRRGLLLLALFSLLVFGFYKRGCICSIGAIGTVAEALFSDRSFLSVSALTVFLLPLIFTFVFGRTFCGSVCPLGALQELVSLKRIRLPPLIERMLRFFPPIFLFLAVLSAATGSDYLICRYDPFIPVFRLDGDIPGVSLAYIFMAVSLVIYRPYCRFICPYAVLLKGMAVLSFFKSRITGGECIDCDFCVATCPSGAVLPPADPGPIDQGERRRLLLSLCLIPASIAAGLIMAKPLSGPLAFLHPRVRLARDIAADRHPTTLTMDSFREQEITNRELFEEAEMIRGRFETVMPLLLGVGGFFFALYLAGSLRQRRRKHYEIDSAKCIGCGRCFAACPVEKREREAGKRKRKAKRENPSKSELDRGGP